MPQTSIRLLWRGKRKSKASRHDSVMARLFNITQPMSDRYNKLTVVLERELDEDYVQNLVKAISLLRGVLKVDKKTGKVGSADYVAMTKAKAELRKSLWEIVG